MRKYLLLGGIISGILFLLLTFFVWLKAFNTWDLSITIFLQKLIPRIWDLPFSLLSLFGSLEIVSIIILVLWFIYRKLNILNVLIGFAFFHIFEIIQKAFVNHPGPPKELVRYFFNFSLPSSGVIPGYSYPSGHTGRTAFLTVILFWIILSTYKFSKLQKKFLVFCILIFDLLMFISRIYLAEHWPTDVIGGILLGTSLALISLSFPNIRLKK